MQTEREAQTAPTENGASVRRPKSALASANPPME